MFCSVLETRASMLVRLFAVSERKASYDEERTEAKRLQKEIKQIVLQSGFEVLLNWLIQKLCLTVVFQNHAFFVPCS